MFYFSNVSVYISTLLSVSQTFLKHFWNVSYCQGYLNNISIIFDQFEQYFHRFFNMILKINAVYGMYYISGYGIYLYFYILDDCQVGSGVGALEPSQHSALLKCLNHSNLENNVQLRKCNLGRVVAHPEFSDVV